MPFVDRPDGVRLFYETHGDGPPLLLLEGMGGDIPGWRRNVPTLAARHRVLCTTTAATAAPRCPTSR